jgi:hypothetical protein
MSRRWHIKAGDVSGGDNKTDLIDCSIALDTDTHQYLFMGPEANGLPLAAVDVTDVFPFQFPKFKSKLSGTDHNDWYITVDYVDGGLKSEQAGGRWSNAGPPGPPDDGGTNPGDSDTWTTQAGVGPHPEDYKKDKEKAAASAASK